MCDLCGNPDHIDPANTVGSSDSTSTMSASKPTYTIDQVATYLSQGYWEDTGRAQRSYDVEPGGQITVNLNGLNSAGQATARQALDSWTAITGIEFVQSSSAQITFDDNQSGAYASSSISGSTVISSHINVASSWSGYGDYYLQTFIHEIGHALGLGHTGNYNGSASYGANANFANDSWQMSIMSYFSQTENTSTDASYSFLATAQLADIAAVYQLYGTPTNVETGDTVYGDGETTGRVGMDLTTRWSVAIVDSGGIDLIDLGSRSYNQMLDLGIETYSNLNGKIGNFSIARGTVIENAITGSGNDIIIGNDANNRLESGAGDDQIDAGNGNDILIGGAGADQLTGGSGADRFVYASLSDAGDTVTDFDLAAGDRVDLGQLLQDIGYAGTTPVSDGIVSLAAGSGGSWLLVTHNGSTTQLAFLTGVSADANVADIIDSGDTPPPPPPPTPGSVDTTYTFDNDFTRDWTSALGLVTDTDGGIDTLDLSAVTYSTRVNLESGGQSKIGSKALTIADGTEIENVLLGRGRDTAYGNSLDNLIAGNGGADRLYGLAGADTLDGGDGADKLYGGDGDDSLDGGAGDDLLDGGIGNDVLHGGEGRNRITSGDGDDTVTAGAGDDRIAVGEGNNQVDAGNGRNQVTTGSGNNIIIAGSGDDKITTGSGNDHITAGDGRNQIKSGDGNDTIITGAKDDRITTGNGNVQIDAGDGRNQIKSGSGNDTITAGSGDDKIDAGVGINIINAGDGKNYIKSGIGNDVIISGSGDDKIYASLGDDSINAGEGRNQIYAGGGDDTITTGSGADKIGSGSGNNTINAGDGKNQIKTGSGHDTIISGLGDDKIDAGLGDDLINAGEGRNQIKSGGGNNTIITGSGADKIDSGDGNDNINAGDGSNQIKSGSGNDTILSGLGDDKIDG
ncbi:MAG: M10 family metallopeptidase C-terminal domain-containing protein, partial [Rhodobacteraceae bacterium]|nr:M10 family metallopeptidase C-terminal domain-containing protein [Paracoccaceae bacterium]